MKKLLAIGLCFLLVFAVTGCSKANENITNTTVAEEDEGREFINPVQEIYYNNSGLGRIKSEYKIDLTEGKVYSVNRQESELKGLEQAKEDDFKLMKTLKPTEVYQLLELTDDLKVRDWKNEYNNNSILDGEQWLMKIKFADGVIKKIKGSNAYPDNWEEFQRRVRAVAGVEF